LATCKGIVGRLDLDEVKRSGYPTPAVLVSRLRLDQARTYAGPHHTYRIVCAAFVLTKSRLGDERDAAATNIAQTILQLLPDATFGRSDIGPAERIAEEPIVTPAIRQSGISITAITWEQDVSLAPLPDDVVVPIELYVRHIANDEPIETFTVTGAQT
jgi:hypothetical protein